MERNVRTGDNDTQFEAAQSINFLRSHNQMLSTQVCSDLQLSTVSDSIQFKTSWGKSAFYETLQKYDSDTKTLRKKQLPLLAFRSAPALRTKIASELEALETSKMDESLQNTDSRISEAVSQILWKPDSYGAFLNTSPTALNALMTWKSIILPGFALIMPLIAIIIPFFVLKFMDSDLTSAAYLERVRAVLLKQFMVPSFLKSRGEHDRIGFIIESLFIGLSLAVFISSLWNQISSALHLRSIWDDLKSRGAAFQTLVSSAGHILDACKALPLKKQRALKYVIAEGDAALETCGKLGGLDAISTFGALWNNPHQITRLQHWIGSVDALLSISELRGICFPRYITNGAVQIDGLYHPLVKGCVRNDYNSSDGHIILTGPNRGGKTTYCKAVGLAIITAQSWGFAWARSMTLPPFAAILTALESTGRLGELSTFEAEIEFAKSVLAQKERPAFIMMDEIFHSTNAGDGIAASRVFLDQLYAQNNMISIISTHYNQLAESYDGHGASARMVDATEDAHGILTYTYKVCNGISDKSSVMEILRERGLTA
jgi:hypothetical protein